jgi:hypothetical protein
MVTAMAIAMQNDYEVWDLLAESHDTAAGYWAEDGLHFAAAGHQMIADHLRPWILCER